MTSKIITLIKHGSSTFSMQENRHAGAPAHLGVGLPTPIIMVLEKEKTGHRNSKKKAEKLTLKGRGLTRNFERR